MINKFEIGHNIVIPGGAEINHNIAEDSDSFFLPKSRRAVVLNILPGGIEVLIQGLEHRVPTFWHQPEKTASK